MKFNGARILIECLIERGVDTIFGYPGGSIIGIYDELQGQTERIRHILTAHEQGAAHAADGFARATGKPGVVLATSGPGATNLVTGIATAYLDSIPMVAITGNVPLSLLGKDSFQEVDITGVTMPITKHNFIVKDIEELAGTIRSAFEIAMEGRQGPVLVDIPKDILAAFTEWETEAPGAAGRRPILPLRSIPKATEAELDIVAAAIAGAERPLIYAGGGVISAGASDRLYELAERIQAPVALSLMGHGAFPSHHPLCTGMIGMHGTKASNMAVNRSDLLIAIGARFSDRVVSNAASFAKNARIVQIDIDPAEVNKNIQSSISLVGDLAVTLDGLLARVGKKDGSGWGGHIKEWKAERPTSHARKTSMPPKLVMEAIHAKVGDDAIITTEVGQHQMWVAQFYPFEKPRTFVSSGGLGTMGFGTGAAMGVHVGMPGRRVVHVAGDGSFRMNLAELATIAHYNFPIVIVLMNNGTLGMVRQWQRMFYKGRYSQTTLDRGPDFMKLADAFGIRAWRVSDMAGFEAAFEKALASGGPALVECLIDIDETVLPMVPSGKPIEQLVLEPESILS
jgi:acetolactate synthase-1/2/3 large subunit